MKSKVIQFSQEGAFTVSKKQRCHYCNKLGHFKKECEEFAKTKDPVNYKLRNKMGDSRLQSLLRQKYR